MKKNNSLVCEELSEPTNDQNKLQIQKLQCKIAAQKEEMEDLIRETSHVEDFIKLKKKNEELYLQIENFSKNNFELKKKLENQQEKNKILSKVFFLTFCKIYFKFIQF